MKKKLIVFLFLIMGCKTMGSEEKVWIYKHDGSLQCEEGGASELSSDEKILKDLGIKVFSSKKSTDGMMRMQLCGSPTGAINAFEIPLKEINKALEKGFTKLSE